MHGVNMNMEEDSWIFHILFCILLY